jgi:hypothetical protein
VPDIRKRVVLLSRSGMHRIVGVFDPSIHEARTIVSFEGIDASLDAVLPRFIVYREMTPLLPETWKPFTKH